MFRDVNTRDLKAVRAEVVSRYAALFPGADVATVNEMFQWAETCFTGHYPGYKAIDVLYHDFEHTLQGTLCLARLMDGYKRAGAVPVLTQRMFELAMTAILFHDTGYLKVTEDTQGTGAKYTLTHVNRSAEFAGRFLRDTSFSATDIKSVQNMIRCTGVSADLTVIPFQNELEKKIGFALATSDLLAQMAAPDYIDKLGILFLEFEESAQFSGKPPGVGFSSLEDLRQKTPSFWKKYVEPKINGDFLGLHAFLNDPPDRNNYYTSRIEMNMRRLEHELSPARAA